MITRKMTAPGAAILFSEMTPAADFSADFHRWYDTEHIPVRMDCPGFVSAQRYRDRNGDGFLAVYELADTGVLSTPEYKVVKENPSALTKRMLDSVTGFTRYLCSETWRSVRDGIAPEQALGAPYLYAVWFEVPEDARADFDAWYEQEHGPMLMKCADWMIIRRFQVVDGAPDSYTHLALHYLADERALASPEREAARGTEWRARLAASDWFNPAYSVFATHGQRHVGNR